jgi:membrane-associated HD superfamily phosphohydrolase
VEVALLQLQAQEAALCSVVKLNLQQAVGYLAELKRLHNQQAVFSVLNHLVLLHLVVVLSLEAVRQPLARPQPWEQVFSEAHLSQLSKACLVKLRLNPELEPCSVSPSSNLASLAKMQHPLLKRLILTGTQISLLTHTEPRLLIFPRRHLLRTLMRNLKNFKKKFISTNLQVAVPAPLTLTGK